MNLCTAIFIADRCYGETCQAWSEWEFILIRGQIAFLGRAFRCLLGMIVMFAAVAEHHHFVGNDFNAGVFHAFLVIPTAGLPNSFYVYLLALVEILFSDLRQVSPGHDV